MLTDEQMTHEAMSKVPKSWTGKAYICPEGHQMHPIRMEYAMQLHAGCSHPLDACCLGGCGWIDQSSFTFDNEYKKRTEGRKEREDEPSGK